MLDGVCICTAGYVLDTQSRCALCPANAFCPDQNTIRNCTNNALSLPGQSSPDACNACPVGYAQIGTATAPISCRLCLPGYVCPTKDNETACQAGTYAPALATACVDCPANTYAGATASACTACSAHATSPGLSGSIDACTCDPGYYKDIAGLCHQCLPGTSCINNQQTVCAPGTSSTYGQGACTPCQTGSYQSAQGASACVTCPAGLNVPQTTLSYDGQAVNTWPTVDSTANNRLYISMNALTHTTASNITEWSFYATQTGCVVTPILFQGSRDMVSGNYLFNPVAVGTQRNTTSAGAQTFAFSDTNPPYLVPNLMTTSGSTQYFIATYIGWRFAGPTCIPYQAISGSTQNFWVAPFDYVAQQYSLLNVAASALPLQNWPVRVTGALTALVPATAQTGTTSIMSCICPDGMLQASNGLCQKICPNGQYMTGPSETECSPCAQGSYCVASIITKCPAGYSSLAGATACVACVNPGTASDIQLYTCGLKNCTVRAPKNLGATTWLGLGTINVTQGNINGRVSTPWLPGDTVLGLVLNPGADRPFALVQQTIDLDSYGLENQPVAFQFSYMCVGLSCPDYLKLEYSQDTGQNFVQVLYMTDFVSNTWSQIASSFFIATTLVPIQMRLTTQMKLSSCILWVGRFQVVTLGSWNYDDIGKLTLSTTDLIDVPRFPKAGSYEQPVPATNIKMTNADLWITLDPKTVYEGYQYVASLWAKGQGNVTFKINEVDQMTVAINSPDARKLIMRSTGAPTMFWIKTAGNLIVKGPSILLRQIIVGCQTCLSDNWCRNNGISNCPANSASKPGSSLQTDCWCIPGWHGRPNWPVGDTPCMKCPLNSFCPGGNNVSFCPNGTKTNGTGAWACIRCEVDEYCALGRNTQCPDHSTSPISSWDVTHCVCDPGYYGTAPDCKLCESGFYCINGSKIACTEHAVSPIGSWDPTQCYCDRGWEGLANAPCVACTEGSFCWTGIRTPCPNNMWSPMYSSFQSNCSCDYGTYPVQKSCALCSAGTYKSKRGGDQCTACGLGTFSVTRGATSNATCIGCSPGTYAVSSSQYQCQPCAAGYYASMIGASTCQTCWAGSYSVMGSSVCTVCMAGTFSTLPAAPSLASCKQCSLGAWSLANSTACTQCGTCLYWKYPAAITFYVNQMTTVMSSTAQHFHFALSNTGKIFAAAGTSIYNMDLTTGALSAALSVQGPSVTPWWYASISTSVLGNYLYLVQNQNVFRVVLDMGAYDITYPSKLATCAVEDSTNPDGSVVLWIVQPTMVRQVDPLLATDISSYSLANGIYACATPADAANLYVVGGFGLKRMAKATGVFTSLLSGTAYDLCQFTPDGNFLLLSSSRLKKALVYSLFDTATTNILANGFVSGAYIDDKTMVMGIDSVGVINVSYSFADSRACIPGQFGNAIGMTSPDSCTTCEPGNLCPGGPNVTSCAPGTYSNATGLRTQAQCMVCPAGLYCPGATCPTGFDCSINSVTGVCTGPDCEGGDITLTCPIGSYSPQTGLSKAADCPQCLKGFYCPDTVTMLQCPNNTDSDEGSHDLSQCTCGPGYRCIITKVVHCSIVLDMRYQDFIRMQASYKQAIAAAAGVDVSLVSIQGAFSVNSGPIGRRLLGFKGSWESKAVEVHTLIHQAQMLHIADLDTHLHNHGLPPHRSIHLSLQSQVVQTYRH